MMRLALIVVALAMLAAPASTRAADSDAPPGAPADWLPHEDWVMKHWLPYKETTMLRLLGIDRSGACRSATSGRSGSWPSAAGSIPIACCVASCVHGGITAPHTDA